MYSFAQRSDLKVMDEPYYALYLLKSGKEHPGQKDTLASQPHTQEEVEQQIAQLADKSGLFIKNMAHHMEYLTLDFLNRFQQVFLIRDPRALISSFSKVIPDPDMQDIGLEMELQLYNSFNLSSEKAPIVIDSGEVLKDPAGVLKQLCNRLDLDWDEKMLRWEAGPRPEDGSWAKYWYHNVHQSTGFAQQQKKPRPIPDHCQGLFEQAQPIYETLFEQAIKA